MFAQELEALGRASWRQPNVVCVKKKPTTTTTSLSLNGHDLKMKMLYLTVYMVNCCGAKLNAVESSKVTS